MNRSTQSLVIAICGLLVAGAVLDDSVLRWVMFSIAIGIGLVLAFRAIRNDSEAGRG
jgi:hypothetical protein